MSQTQSLFSAQAQTTRVSLTTVSSAAVLLPFKGNSIRIVNEGPNTCYVALATTAALAVAVTPTSTPSANATAVLSGTDVTMSIDASQQLYFAGITATGTAVLDIQVGEGM